MSIDTILLCFLHDISTGESCRSLSARFGISVTTYDIYGRRLARLIIEHLVYEISYALSASEAATQKYLFGRYYEQPEAVCAMDGVFVPRIAPPKFGEAYYSGHKKAYGIKMLAVCDFNRKFIYINVGHTARMGDSIVFRLSKFKRDIENGSTVFNEDNKILVDSAFADELYLIKSTQRIESGSVRVRIEHALGNLKRCLGCF